MLSFQDIIDKTVAQRKLIRETLDKGVYHPEDASLYEGLKVADAYEIKQTLDSMSLAEVLVKGSTAMGADAIVAAKVHDTLVYAAKPYDLCPLIGYVADRWEGGDLTVNVAVDGSYVPKPATSYGKGAEVNVKFVPCTLSPVTYTLPVLAGSDLIEDNAYSIIQWHVEQAGKACGETATDLMLAIVKAAPGGDGDGDKNTSSTNTTDTTTYQEVLDAAKTVGADKFRANTMLITDEAYAHSASVVEVEAETPGDFGKYAYINAGAPAAGFDLKFDYLDTKFCNRPVMHDATDAEGEDFTTCVTLILDRGNAVLTGRKRWLEIKDFSNPFEDIAGAVVSFRQDSVTLYKDAICVLTEHT